MNGFDVGVVERWFALALSDARDLQPAWGIELTEDERAALQRGASLLRAAVRPGEFVLGPGGRDDRTETAAELPARRLESYLSAVAAGVADARARMVIDEELPDAVAASMTVAAGLNAGAAALQGAAGGPDPTRPGALRVSEPSAAHAAWLAGIDAAEEAVKGSAVTRVTRAAAAAAGKWRIGRPADPDQRLEYRTRALVGLVLLALAEACGEPTPAEEPAPCGALRGENLGHAFPAEVTFQFGSVDADFGVLTAALRELSTDVTTWQRDRELWCHVHTDRPGEVIEQAYAAGSVFDLLITRRDD